MVGSTAPSEVDRARALLSAYQAEIARSDPSRAGRLHYECARLYESPLGDFVKAAEHYARAHTLLPDYAPAVLGARRAHLVSGNTAAALPLYDVEIKLVGDERRKALLLYQKGRLLEENPATRRAAVAALGKAAQLDPQNYTLLATLAQTVTREEAWDDLDRTLEQAAHAVTQDAHHRAALLARRARLLEVRRPDKSQAIELYRKALELDAGVPGALSALKHLEYVGQRWGELVAVLEKEVELAQDPVVRALALHRIGRIQLEQLGDLDRALVALQRASGEVPQDRALLEELVRALEVGQRHAALREVLGRLAEALDSPAEKVVILHRIGRLEEDRLGDEQAAIVAYEQALAVDPTYLPAVQAATTLYTRRRQWEPLIELLGREADRAQDPLRRADAFSRIADLYEHELRKPEQAVQYHTRALGSLPGHAPAFRALCRLFEQMGKLEELVELYERAVEETTENSAKIAHLLTIGLYVEDALHDPARAIGVYRRVLLLDPQHVGALQSLARAAERGGEWRELVGALLAESELGTDRVRSAALVHRAGEVLEERLGEVDAAVGLYRKVLQVSPRHAAALNSLGRLFYRMGRWEELLDTYRRELKSGTRTSDAAALLVKMGEIAEERLGRDDEALGFYKEAVDIAPANIGARRALGRLMERAGKWLELVKLLEQEPPLLSTVREQAHSYTRIGEVYESRLADAAKALSAYDQALKVAPDFRPALDGRTRLLAQARSWARLADELAREAQAARDPSLAVAALLREAEIRRDDLGDADRAVRSFEAVLERDPNHLGALLALESLYAKLAQWEALANVYTRIAQVSTDPEARAAALYKLSELTLEKGLGAPEQARQALFGVLGLLPNHLGALIALERLSLAEGDRALLSQVDARLSGLVSDPVIAAAHQSRLGEALEAAGDGQALDVYRAALKADPENLAAAHGLARVADRYGDPALLEEAAEYERRVARDKETAARLLVKSAALRARKNELAEATRALDLALTLHPDHEPAAERLFELCLAQGAVDGLIAALTKAAQAATQRERRAALWIRLAELYADHKHDLPAGLAALRRVTQETPGHLPALLALADLYARDGQWNQAAATLESTLKHPASDEQRVTACLRLAALLDEHVGDARRALEITRYLLELAPNNRSALARLVRIQIRARQYEAAAETTNRLVSTATNDTERAEALAGLARLERARGDINAALRAYEQAVEVVGVQGEVNQELRELLEEQRRRGHPPAWRGYANALSRHLEIGQHDAATTAEVCVELARVLGNELRQNDEALTVLAQGLSANPDNIDLRVEHAVRLEHAGQLPRALEELRSVLELDVTRLKVWRDLIGLLGRMQRQADAALATAVLVALGAASEVERSTVASLPVRAAMVPVGSFGPAELLACDLLPADDAVRDVLASTAESLEKVHPPDLSRYGLSPRDRIAPRSGHPVRTLAERVASIFGVADFQFYVQNAHQGSVEVEFTDPVSVIVPAYVARLKDSQQAFLLGRVMSDIARQLHAIDRLPPQDVELLVLAALHSVRPELGYGQSDDEGAFGGYAKRIHKSLSRRSRRGLEEVAERWAIGTKLDMPNWIHKVRVSAARAALVVADELPGSVTLVRQQEGDLAGIGGEAQLRGVALAQDLLRFWVSETAFALRRRFGLA